MFADKYANISQGERGGWEFQWKTPETDDKFADLDLDEKNIRR
jgi:hypothetical protein